MTKDAFHNAMHDSLYSPPPDLQHKALAEREQALENSFFHLRDRELLNNLRRQLALGDREAALVAASGIQDRILIHELAENGAKPDLVAALGLVPLVEVAWADGGVSGVERAGVLKAAVSMGVVSGSAAYQLLEAWLEQEPDEGVEEAWKGYVKALVATLHAEQIQKLKAAVMGRAQAVAEAAGGFLGLGRKISVTEQAALDRLSGAFNM